MSSVPSSGNRPPDTDEREAKYGSGILILSLISLAAVVAIVWGEFAGYRLLAGGAVGVVLLAYSFILLFLRKGGFTGV